MTTDKPTREQARQIRRALQRLAELRVRVGDLAERTKSGEITEADAEQELQRLRAENEILRRDALDMATACGSPIAENLRDTPTTTEPGTTPDPIEQAREVFDGMLEKHAEQLATVVRELLPHVEREIVAALPPFDPERSTATFYEIALRETAPLANEPGTTIVPVSVREIGRTDDLWEILESDEQAENLAESGGAMILAVSSYMRAVHATTDEVQHGHLLAVVAPWGMAIYARTYDESAGKWRDPMPSMIETREAIEEHKDSRLVAALGKFYALHVLHRMTVAD